KPERKPERWIRNRQRDWLCSAVYSEAIDAGEPVTLVLRIYLESDLTAPAERPYRMRVKGAEFESLTVQVEAGYYDLINTAALRHIYNVSEFPGLKYWP
ncbi:DUF1833 family protein, partial [Pseudomonas aeruginosa]|uniref:DUF1833 family protein n=1 Tax=Pseudomonas aeruginosa TaxID=287 RepID=UPI001EE1A913